MIDQPYVLFTRIDIYQNRDGRYFCDPLWAKDLKLHLDYIQDFRLCCPVVFKDDVSDLVDISEFNIAAIHSLNKDYGYGSVFKNFIPNYKVVKSAVGAAEIIHSGGAGWAFPLSFYILFIRFFRSFKWVFVVESSFWMRDKQAPFNLRSFITHGVYKTLLTRCAKKADARIFTQTFYRRFFLGDETKGTLIAPATWVNKENIVADDSVVQRYESRKNKTMELLFPARLIADKGIAMLFETIKILQEKGVTVNITMMGQGAMQQDCIDFAKGDYGSVGVTFQEPVEYGKPFFDFLHHYDFVLVPNLKEEQPRIIYDAFSQGVSVVAADTSGILDVTEKGKNASIFERGNAKSFADAITELIQQPDAPMTRGLYGLRCAKGKTHAQMHIDRQAFFNDTIFAEQK